MPARRRPLRACAVLLSPRGPRWRRHGADWPHREASRFVEADGLSWHVQQMGEGPPLLLLHGTGASTHSWRAAMPLLARRFTVVASDLPGHGFSASLEPRRANLPAMARALAALLAALELSPRLAVGHSAGAAILLRMALDGQIVPAGIVSVNGALFPFRGMAGQVFPSMARMLLVNPVSPHVFALGAGNRRRVERLLAETGSRLDEAGVRLYQRLFRQPGHVAGALAMMANWDLEPLLEDLPRLLVPLLHIVGGNDRAVSPSEGDRLARRLPGVEIVRLPGLGHLAHEEDPQTVVDSLLDFAVRVGALPESSAPHGWAKPGGPPAR